MRVVIEDGKYTYVNENGSASVLRYDEHWRDVTGDKFIYCMAAEIETLREQVEKPKDGDAPQFMFKVGQEYETQAGDKVMIIDRTRVRGYECLECSDGRYRYDRSTHSDDAGRCTGTDHEYSYPHNLKRDDMTVVHLQKERIRIYEYLESTCPEGFADEVFRQNPVVEGAAVVPLDPIQSNTSGECTGSSQQDTNDRREDQSLVTKPQNLQEEFDMLRSDFKKMQTDYNDAINHAIGLGLDADTFLRCWNEGDWKGCAEFGFVPSDALKSGNVRG